MLLSFVLSAEFARGHAGDLLEHTGKIALVVIAHLVADTGAVIFRCQQHSLGMINAKVISKGRYGRTRELSVSIPQGSLERIKVLLERDLHMD